MTPATLIRNVEVTYGERVDVLIRGDTVAAIGIDLDTPRHAEVVDGHGGALIPGLHDHHIHLYALAAERMSVHCGLPRVRSAGDLAAALHAAPGDDWIRGVGYHESVAGLLDSTSLDALHARRPVRIQHRSGAMWILNSRAAALTELDSAHHPGVERDDDGHPTGRVWRADTWLRDRLPDNAPPDLSEVGAELARYGITGLTEATPALTPSTLDSLVHAHMNDAVPQRLHLLGAPHGFTSPTDTVTAGPCKIVIADSEIPDLEALVRTIGEAHAADRGVAVHCVTRTAFAVLLAALDEAGSHPSDRIEHAAVVPSGSLTDLRARGLTVVTQPGFLTDRGDSYLRDVDPEDLPDLYRCRSLIDGGVPLGLSSDAPYGPVDPWEVIDAAVTRRAPTGEVVGKRERLTARSALDRYLTPLDDPGGPPRSVRVGVEADLVLMDRPIREVLECPRDQVVRRVWIRGRESRLRR